MLKDELQPFIRKNSELQNRGVNIDTLEINKLKDGHIARQKGAFAESNKNQTFAY